MGTYTAEQLKGTGTPIEAIAALTGSKFTLNNPLSGSAYFTVAAVKANLIDFSGSATNASGTYASFTGIDENILVTSSYRSSVVVPPGVHSYDFTSSANIARSSSMLKATGGMTLVITGSYSGSAS